ncbi:tRNA(Ile)-lysidine synthase [Lacunisphaera limnophila]|uniref:tRNA(Ile)-lysidine synthase n=1 Tax=Lacunisphaera limnophila TaxID=1838286 RepID=A0A1D8AWY6_9BACT|nr:tRNA lysidine(34) synthetase TilS [Lacunisphaera limnophila]AOS45394.1 tRNA(Ile)-lysidine synthase [Lacunisphaera limnophila]
MNRRQQAERVGAALPKSGLHPAVLRWVAAKKSRGPWGVALSGGADSLALLYVLRAHWPEQPLIALHFNHRLRGRASEADAKFCREVTRALGIKGMTGVWRAAPKHASEATARAARQAFFARAMQQTGARVLWLAHQQDDIAESLLMRLARGSGTGGLASPRPVQTFADGRVYLRPLLGLKKATLQAALKTVGVRWREDVTNRGSQYFRNRVRRDVIPRWQEAAGRDAVAGAARTRELLEEDDAALEAWLERLAPLRRGVLDMSALDGVPRAVTRRALHRWLLAVQPDTDLSRQGFEVLLAAVERGTATRFSLGRTGFAVIRQGKLGYRRG